VTDIDATPLEKSYIFANERRMAYHERGTGETVVFLHGNPTSSYLWRNVIPHVEPFARCLAPDLIGMGDSDKLEDPGPGSYRFVEHRAYLDAFLDAVYPGDRITFVIHDWGSALGLDWARRHPERVAGIAYMEAIFPMRWDQFPEGGSELFQAFRSEAGEDLILRDNTFVEGVLPGAVLRDLTDEEMEEYRRPFIAEAERWPTLTWPRELPIDGEPADVCEITEAYTEWFSTSDVPKLFVNAEPGALLTGEQRERVRSFPNQTEVTVAGSHFVQEDSPHEIGRAIADWLPNKPQRN
jgi:haloalkane dehalogenase